MLQMSTDPVYKEHLLSLLKTLSGQHAIAGRRGMMRAEAEDAIAAAQSSLATLLKEGDPLNSERVLNLLDLPYGEDSVENRRLWSLARSV
jgi:hypothetical protein